MVSNIALNSHGTGCGETRRAAQRNSVMLLVPGNKKCLLATNFKSKSPRVSGSDDPGDPNSDLNSYSFGVTFMSSDR
jgi:hypothetical protein